jgi:hypothetical protein
MALESDGEGDGEAAVMALESAGEGDGEAGVGAGGEVLAFTVRCLALLARCLAV